MMVAKQSNVGMRGERMKDGRLGKTETRVSRRRGSKMRNTSTDNLGFIFNLAIVRYW
jgi:hypothetical protein